jgi:hypothetical protein
MENWKRALIAGSAGLGTVMLLRRQKTAGLVLAGISLAVLASEYPEKFAEIRERIPEYVDRGTQFIDVVSRVGERLATLAERRGEAWYDALLNA